MNRTGRVSVQSIHYHTQTLTLSGDSRLRGVDEREMALQSVLPCMARPTRDSRRRFLQLAGTAAVVGVAGCSGGGGGESGGENGGGSGGDGDGSGGSESGSGGGDQEQSGQGLEPVPDEYVTATAQDGTERSPDSVATKEAVQYQSTPKDGQQCTDCRFYIPDKNGDGLGACAVVEGTIEPEAWCSSFVQYDG